MHEGTGNKKDQEQQHVPDPTVSKYVVLVLKNPPSQTPTFNFNCDHHRIHTKRTHMYVFCVHVC